MRASVLALLGGAALVAAGCASLPDDGALMCSADSAHRCPSGFHCADDNRCYRDGHDPDLGVDTSDMSGDTSDLAGQDGGGDLGVVPTLGLLAGAIGGTGYVDRPGALARFNQPSGMATDGAGNLYVVDSTNSVIRKIVIATGAVSTLAGQPGVFGAADGVGSAASFNGPYGLAADGVGNLYVADRGNSTIRKIVIATAAVTTLAGTAAMAGQVDGVGPAARFANPAGLCADNAGNVYVADTFGFTIRKVVVATATVSTIAGAAMTSGTTDGVGGAARFNQPYGVASDGSGNLYVADSNNATIRKIVLATGAVTTFAGTAGVTGSQGGTGTSAQFYFPQGVVTDGAGNLFVADRNNQAIRKIALSNASVSYFVGTAGVSGPDDGIGMSARLHSPVAVVLDGTGNLLIADQDNNTIRKVALTTTAVTTLAGTASHSGNADGVAGAARFNTPEGFTTDGTSLFVSDNGNTSIRTIAMGTNMVSTLTAPNAVDGPRGLASDGAGNLFVADPGGTVVRQVVVATSAVTILAGLRFKSGTTDGVGTAARFGNPADIAFGNDGNLYVADSDNSNIRKIVIASATVSTLAGNSAAPGSTDGTGTAASFNIPQGIASDGAGTLYVADTRNDTIRKVVVATGAVTTIAGTAMMAGSTDGTAAAARFNAPQGVAVDANGNLWVADTGNATVRKIVLATGAVTTVIGVPGQHGVALGPLPASLNVPVSVSALADGRIIVVDQLENAVLVAK
jgi:sugar lactone lactonase YvrE